MLRNYCISSLSDVSLVAFAKRQTKWLCWVAASEYLHFNSAWILTFKLYFLFLLFYLCWSLFTVCTLAWRIPWTEEPGRLQSMGLRRVRHDWGTSLSPCIEGNGNPPQYSCLKNPGDGEAWWAAAYGVAQSRTRLKRLSSITLMLFQKPLWSRQGNSPSKFKLWISKLFQDPSGQLVRAPAACKHSSPTNVSTFTSPHPRPPGGGCQSIYLLPLVDPCLLEGRGCIPFLLNLEQFLKEQAVQMLVIPTAHSAMN